MSVQVMTMVFNSTLDPSHRLVMLCLADRADDDGTSAFPSKARIAAKSGLSERTVQRILGELRNSGLISITAEASAALHRPREYALDLKKLRAMERETPCPQGTQAVCEGETYDAEGETPATPYSSCDSSEEDSSLLAPLGERPREIAVQVTGDGQIQKHQMESAGLKVTAAIPDDVPVSSMIASYHQMLPMGHKTKLVSPSVVASLRRMWKTLGKSPQEWLGYLQRIQESDWLTGRKPDRDGCPFSALDLLWITGPKNFEKITGGRFDNRKGSRINPNSGSIQDRAEQLSSLLV